MRCQILVERDDLLRVLVVFLVLDPPPRCTREYRAPVRINDIPVLVSGLIREAKHHGSVPRPTLHHDLMRLEINAHLDEALEEPSDRGLPFVFTAPRMIAREEKGRVRGETAEQRPDIAAVYAPHRPPDHRGDQPSAKTARTVCSYTAAVSVTVERNAISTSLNSAGVSICGPCPAPAMMISSLPGTALCMSLDGSRNGSSCSPQMMSVGTVMEARSPNSDRRDDIPVAQAMYASREVLKNYWRQTSIYSGLGLTASGIGVTFSCSSNTASIPSLFAISTSRCLCFRRSS